MPGTWETKKAARSVLLAFTLIVAGAAVGRGANCHIA